MKCQSPFSGKIKKHISKCLLKCLYPFYLFHCRYVSILVELTRMEGTRHGRLIAAQMLDVAIRVQAIRPFAVTQMVRKEGKQGIRSQPVCISCKELFIGKHFLIGCIILLQL